MQVKADVVMIRLRHLVYPARVKRRKPLDALFYQRRGASINSAARGMVKHFDWSVCIVVLSMRTSQRVKRAVGGTLGLCRAPETATNHQKTKNMPEENESNKDAGKASVISPLFAVGDMVSYKKGKGILHCGCGTYERAVVASLDPFVLVSEWGDMKWTATVTPEDFERAGEANRKELLAVLDRFPAVANEPKPEDVRGPETVLHLKDGNPFSKTSERSANSIIKPQKVALTVGKEAEKEK